MKRLLFGTTIIMVLAFSAFGQKGAVGKIDPTKGVHDAFDRLVEGIKEVDVNKVMGVYAKDSKLLIFNNNGTATQGWDEVKSVNEKIYAKLSNVTLDITGLRIEMLGTKAAYVTCKWKQTQENNGKMEILMVMRGTKIIMEVMTLMRIPKIAMTEMINTEIQKE